jgi:hypothetical protein
MIGNTRQVTFLYGLKIEPRNLGPGIYDHIHQIIRETTFVKENFCVLSVTNIKVINVKVTNGQSDHIANLEITTECVYPEIGKVFSGIVTNVIEQSRLTVVTVEGKVDVIVKGVTNKEKDERVAVAITRIAFVNGKIVCMGIFEN